MLLLVSDRTDCFCYCWWGCFFCAGVVFGDRCCYCCWAWRVLIRYWSFCMVVDDAVLVAAAWFFWAGFGRRRCQFLCVQTYRIDTSILSKIIALASGNSFASSPRSLAGPPFVSLGTSSVLQPSGQRYGSPVQHEPPPAAGFGFIDQDSRSKARGGEEKPTKKI
jgi:hypothetical protein